MRYDEPDNSDDVIDSRQVIERIDSLRTDIEAYEEEPYDDGDSTVDEKREELRILEALAEQASAYASDWQRGETLVRDSYWEDYARELAIDCAGSREEADFLSGRGMTEHWPMTYATIDWEAAAEALQTDYTDVDFGGVTYWIRAY